MQSYDRSRVLIPTLGDDTEYGAAPAPPPKASRQQGDGYGRAKMVVAALGGAATRVGHWLAQWPGAPHLKQPLGVARLTLLPRP